MIRNDACRPTALRTAALGFAATMIALTCTGQAVASVENGPIVFISVDSEPFPDTTEVLSVNADGSKLKTLVNGEFEPAFPSVSPDGTRVVYVSSDDSLRIASIKTGEDPQIPGTSGIGANHPTWTPDGFSIVFACSTGICFIPAVGGVPVTISGPSIGADNPAVHPDGSTVAFEYNSDVNFDIYTVPIGGGITTQITSCNSGNDCRAPTYSPDGLTIALTAENAVCGVGRQIATVSSSASLATPACMANSLDGDDAPDFSPDGTEIVAHDGSVRLVKLSSDGADRTPIDTPALSGETGYPSWGRVPDRVASEALCGKIFFDALRKAEVKKAQISVKFIKAGCDVEATEELVTSLEKFDVAIDKIVDKGNESIDNLGGIPECDSNLRELLPLDRQDLLDGFSSGQEFIDNRVIQTCNSLFDGGA